MCDVPEDLVVREKCRCKSVCRCCCVTEEVVPVVPCTPFEITPGTYAFRTALFNASCQDRWGIVPPPTIFGTGDYVKVDPWNTVESNLTITRVDGLTTPIGPTDLVTLTYGSEQLAWFPDPTTAIVGLGWRSSLSTILVEQTYFTLASAETGSSTSADPEGRCVQVFLYGNGDTAVDMFVILKDVFAGGLSSPVFPKGAVMFATFDELTAASASFPTLFKTDAFAQAAWFIYGSWPTLSST